MNKENVILYVGGFELPDKNAAAHLVLNNAKIFSTLGYDVIFCGINKELDFNKRDCSELVGEYKSFPRPYPKKIVEWFVDFVSINDYKKILDQNQSIKFVIAYNIHSIQMMKLMKYCKQKQIYFISNVTEWYENKFSVSPIKLVKFVDTLLVMKCLNKKADGIIANSSYIEKYYHNYVKDILVMPPLVDTCDEKWRMYKYVSHEEIRFVYSGSPEMNDTKDRLYPVIKCFDELSDYNFNFSILGITKEQFLSQYPEMSDCLDRMKKKIIFYGRVSHSKSIEKLFSSDFSIFIRDATRKNNAGFPTKFVEGFTSGDNIIANNISDIKKYFPRSDASILLSDSADESIFDALERSLKLNSSFLKEKRRNGLVDNPFDYRRWIKKVGSFMSNYK